ncbi:hypothetical protein AB0C00_32700, partial [Micromonospora carbonacea]
GIPSCDRPYGGFVCPGAGAAWGGVDVGLPGADKARVATALLGRKADTIDVSAPDVVTFR